MRGGGGEYLEAHKHAFVATKKDQTARDLVPWSHVDSSH